MLGFDGKRLGEVGGRVLETLQGGECRAMIDEGICRTRLARDSLFKREKRFLMPARFFKNAAAIVPGTAIRRIERESQLDAFERLLVAIERHQRHAAIVLSLDEIRFQRERRIEADQRFGRTVQTLQGAAARKEGLGRARIDAERIADDATCFFKASDLVMEKPDSV